MLFLFVCTPVFSCLFVCVHVCVCVFVCLCMYCVCMDIQDQSECREYKWMGLGN